MEIAFKLLDELLIMRDQLYQTIKFHESNHQKFFMTEQQANHLQNVKLGYQIICDAIDKVVAILEVNQNESMRAR